MLSREDIEKLNESRRSFDGRLSVAATGILIKTALALYDKLGEYKAETHRRLNEAQVLVSEEGNRADKAERELADIKDSHEKPFRIVKHMGEYTQNKVIKYFKTYNDAVKENIKRSDLFWLECLCVNGEWYGLQ